MASHADTPDRGDNIERSYSPEPLSAVEEGSAAVVGKAKERDGPSSESESRRNRSEAFNTRSLPPLGDGVSRLPGGGGKGTKKTKFIYGNYHRYYGYRVRILCSALASPLKRSPVSNERAVCARLQRVLASSQSCRACRALSSLSM